MFSLCKRGIEFGPASLLSSKTFPSTENWINNRNVQKEQNGFAKLDGDITTKGQVTQDLELSIIENQ
jgi:hypothetical protein